MGQGRIPPAAGAPAAACRPRTDDAHLGQFTLVGDRPEAVPQAVGGAGRQKGRAARGDLVDELGGGPAAALVEQEDRLEVGLRGLHQLPAARDRARRDVLVRLDDTRGQRHQVQRADQAALQHASRVRSARRVQGELLVDIQRRLRVGDQDAGLQPAGQLVGRILKGAAWLARRMPGQDKADDVVRVAREELVLDVGRNHVVRWRGDLGEPADPVLGITDAPKRREHEV
jgi:hypothetical protein